LERYRDQLCTFNDDIQGTAAIAAATLLSAINVTGIPLEQQRIVVLGFGTAGIGIANLLLQLMLDKGIPEADARACIYAIGRYGLITEEGKGVRPEQLPYARKQQEVLSWAQPGQDIELFDVIRNAKTTALIGVSGQPGVFTESAIREMAKHTERPIIFPLSNPVSCSEAHPQDLLNWTDGRALIGTGSPFGPVSFGGKIVPIDQTNNSYIFPGLALGIIASKARRVTDTMILAAAKELARLVPTQTDKHASLLPSLSDSRQLSRSIARAVGRQAIQDGQAQIAGEEALDQEIQTNIWEPEYVPYRRRN
jgi:malate dehydrogenase (oxaloacetate-decarboxylating)